MAAYCLVESLIVLLKGSVFVLPCSKVNVKATSETGMHRKCFEKILVTLMRIEIEMKEMPTSMERTTAAEVNINRSYFRSTFLLWLISYEQ